MAVYVALSRDAYKMRRNINGGYAAMIINKYTV